MLWRALGVMLLLGAGYLLLWPVPIQPLAWQPPPLPVDDPRFAINTRLAAVQRIAQGMGAGPEAINIDASGRLVTGYIDGRVMRFAADGSAPEQLANTGGRPLGLDFAANGDVIVADAVRGLLRIDGAGKLSVVADHAAGIPIGFADDVVVSREQIAYFSDASTRFGVHQVMDDFFEHRPNGRLLATDLRSGETKVLMPALHFANGVALGPGERYLLITETARYRVWRYWLRGERAGEAEILIENLPGFPDNITFNGRDRFWLALYAPRTAALDALLPQPFLRKIVARLPAAVQPAPVMHGFALGLDLNGKVVVNLQNAEPGAYAPITSVREGSDYLYFGSLSAPSMARLPLAELSQ